MPQGGAYPQPLDDAKQVDLQWAELQSTRTQLVAILKVSSLNPESEPTVDHYYEIDFSNGGERYHVTAGFNRTGDTADVYHVIAGGDPPEDSDSPGSSAGQGIGTAEGVLDTRKGTVTLTADLAVFATVKALSGSLTKIRVATWSGGSAVAVAAYGSDDFGKTTKPYRLGTRSCVG